MIKAPTEKLYKHMCTIRIRYQPISSIKIYLHIKFKERGGDKEGHFYLTTHSIHFIYGYMASDI